MPIYGHFANGECKGHEMYDGRIGNQVLGSFLAGIFYDTCSGA